MLRALLNRRSALLWIRECRTSVANGAYVLRAGRTKARALLNRATEFSGDIFLFED